MSTELLKEKQAAVLAIPNPMWTKPKFQGNPLAKGSFALLGNSISELKFLFLFFALEEKCFCRNSLIPLLLHAGRSGGHWQEVAAVGMVPGRRDWLRVCWEGVWGKRKGVGRGQGCSGGEVPEPSSFLRGLWQAGAA